MNARLTLSALCAALCLAIGAPAARAAGTQVLVEDFEDAFPAWEGRWFKQNSNAMNYICLYPAAGGCSFRLVPDGLAIWTPDAVSNQPLNVRFNDAFGHSIVHLEFDVAAVFTDPLNVYDSAGQLIFSQIMNPTAGLFSDPGIYEHFAISSTTGVGRIEFAGSAAGNIVIDNIAATVTAVPEPASWALALAGVAVLGQVARRRRSS